MTDEQLDLTLAGLDDDEIRLHQANAGLREVRDMNMSTLTPKQLVAVIKMADAAVKHGAAIAVDSKRKLGQCLHELGFTRSKAP